MIINKENKPSDKEIFLEKLRSLLERYQEGHKKYSMIKTSYYLASWIL